MYIIITQQSCSLCNTLITELEIQRKKYIDVDKSMIPKNVLVGLMKEQPTYPLVLKLEQYNYLGALLPSIRKWVHNLKKVLKNIKNENVERL